MNYMTSVRAAKHLSGCMCSLQSVGTLPCTNNTSVLSQHFKSFVQLISGYDSSSTGSIIDTETQGLLLDGGNTSLRWTTKQ